MQTGSIGGRSVLRALADPVRLRILATLGSRSLSAAELGRELGISQALASYHLRRLLSVGLVDRDGSRPRRGGTERLYVATDPARTRSVASAEPQDTAMLLAALSNELQRRGAAYAPGELAYVADAEVWIEPARAHVAQQRLEGLMRELLDGATPAGTPGTAAFSVSAALFRLDLAEGH